MATLSPEQQVIREIRRNNGVEEELLHRALQDPALSATIKHLKGGYTRALDILSDELYSKPAHCVLELIQNAVDNSYEGVSPTLEMELRRSDLQIWCNEVGFNEANVKAFCSIGNSTKKNQRGYIGEKGIGAKSMFKVATKVTVQSRGYSFVLDREKELGMISPIWVDTAVQDGRQDWTGINLHFGPNKPFDDLKSQLLEIRDTILLFLPKLSAFRVNIDNSCFSVERSEKGNIVSLKTTSYGRSTVKNFLRIEETIEMKVSDPKREGQTDTEVVLAFPLKDNGQPDVSTQPNVHAFLPLRRVGFKFVVQADFLTAANREDVLTDNPWNTTIRDSLSSTFLDAVNHLRVTPSLEFTWPRFIPRPNDISDPFFKLVATKASKLLASAPIIRCSDGVDRLPSQVRFVGSFKDANGRPFVEPQHVGFHYISSEYPSDVVAILESQLHVAEMSFSNFIAGLITMNDRGRFKHSDTTWLEGVCGILISHGFNWNSLLDSRMRQLPLIQLSNRTWVSCQSCDKYFFDSSGLSFPSGLTVQVVSPLSSQSSNRCSVLRKLGVRDLDVSEVIKQIIALNRGVTPSFQVTLEQVLYLYNHRSLLKTGVTHIHLYDQYESSHAGESLYMDNPRDSGTDRLSTLFGDQALFVHNDFQRPVGLSNGSSPSAHAVTQWQDWLVTAFGVRTTPRIVDGRPAAEFRAIIDRYRLDDSPRLFRLLKKYWSGMSAQLVNSPKTSFQAYFRGLEVRCKGGQVAPLHTTFFPSRQILQYGGDDLPLLNISDHLGDWSFLSDLGVSMQPDGRFFLKQLVALSQMSGDKVNSTTIVGLYDQINARFVEFSSEVLTAFREGALIFVDQQWYNSQDVVWHGPSYLTLMPALKEKYSHLKMFFQERLRIKDAPPDIIAKELQHFSSNFSEVRPDSSEHHHLLRLLRYASRSVDSILEKKLADWTTTAHSWPLFPVRYPTDNPGAPIKLVAATDSFFVPDTSGQLHTLFRDVATFLALDEQQLHESTSFLEHIGVLRTKRMDECVSRTVEIDDQAITASSSWDGPLNDDDSQYFNMTLPYLQRYFYYKCKRRRLGLTEFRVYNVSAIKTSYTLRGTEHTKEMQHDTWVDLRGPIASIFLANEAAATVSGRLFVGKNIADVLNIDIMFMMMLVDRSITDLDFRMTLMGIGLHVPPAEDEDDDALILPQELHSSLPRTQHKITAAGGAVAVGSSHSRPSRASKSFFDRSGRDEVTIRPPAVPADPRQSLILYVTSDRGREDIEQSGARARSSGIPAATRFKDAALDDRVPQPTPLCRTAGAILSLAPVTPIASASTLAPPAQHARLDAEEAPDNVIALTGKLEELSLRQGAAPRQSLVFTEFDLAPTRALEIGFLGEQYVFELLKSTLPNFTVDNWTSDLREFANLPPFGGVSYADFQYHDMDGELTRQLLPHEPEIHGATPEIFIEVKSTSHGQDEIFHMKRQQFRRAAEMWRGLDADAPPKRLYVLFRVSNVGNAGDPVLKAYVDAHDLLVRGLMYIESASVEVRIRGEEM